MNALRSGHLAQLLERLHRDADAADRQLMADLMAEHESSGASLDEAARQLMADERADYRATYARHAGHFLAVSPAYGQFLYAMARACKARRIVEFGTSMGLSTIYLAAAVRDNGGGEVIGTELEPAKVARARSHIQEAGLEHIVDVRHGDALETLQGIEPGIDMALIDGAWSLYLPVLKMLEPALSPGATVLGENSFATDYLAYVRDPANGYFSRPLEIDEGRGNEFSVRTP